MFNIENLDKPHQFKKMERRIKAMMRETRGCLNGLKVPRDNVEEEFIKAHNNARTRIETLQLTNKVGRL